MPKRKASVKASSSQPGENDIILGRIDHLFRELDINELGSGEIALPAIPQDNPALNAIDQGRGFTSTPVHNRVQHLDITRSLNRSVSYSQVLDYLRTNTALGNPAFSNLSIFWFDQPGDANTRPVGYTLAVEWQAAPGEAPRAGRIKIETWNALENLMQPDQVLVIDDVENDQHLSKNVRHLIASQMNARGLMILPLIIGENWCGCLVGVANHPLSFHPDEVQQVEMATEQAAIVIQNLYLKEQIARRSNQLQLLFDITQSAHRELNLSQLLNLTVKEILQRLGYHQVTIYLPDETGVSLAVQASAGPASDSILQNYSQIKAGGATVVGQVALNHQICQVDNLADKPLARLIPEAQAEIGLPLKTEEHLTGVLDILTSTESGFRVEEVALLQLVARQLAIAIENASTYRREQQISSGIRKKQEEKFQFLSRISYELQSPLNTIQSFSQVLLRGVDGTLNDLQRKDIQIIKNSSQQLSGILADILDLWKINARQITLHTENAVNLADLVNSVLATIQGLLSQKPITLEKNLAAHLPPIHTDPVKLRTALLRLLSYCVESTEKGKITLEVTISQGRKDTILVHLSDTSQGLSLDDQNKLLQPLLVEDSQSTPGEGYYGLALARQLVELLGGVFGWDTKPGQGNHFWFILPIQKPESGQDSERGLPGPLSQRRILVIENTPRVITRYESFLHKHGYQVIPSTDLRKVVDLIREHEPRLILLDASMQSILPTGRTLSGWQVLQRLKTDPVTAYIPVIICSLEKGQEKALKLGAAAFLTKPIAEDDLVATVNTVIEQL